jgi:hypothetical protein
MAALGKIMEIHAGYFGGKQDDKSVAARAESAAVIKQVKELLDEVTGRKVVQLSLEF